MTELPPALKRAFDRLERDRAAATARAERTQATLDQLVVMAATQGDELRTVQRMLRRREEQLAKMEREIRRLRRLLGLDDPDPEPGAQLVPEEDHGKDVDALAEGTIPSSDKDTQGVLDDGHAGDPGNTHSDNTAPKQDDVDDCGDTEDGGTTDSDGTTRKQRVGGRRAPPDHLPADEERHEVCACAHCGGDVWKRDVLETSVYSAVPSYVRRRIIHRERVVCANPACGRATTAPMPPMPCERALYDCAFIAWIVTMKFAFLMPLDRIWAMLASRGVHIPMSTLVHLVARATDLAEAVDGEHLKQLKAGKYICFDGTGLKVLMRGQDKAWDGYLEVFARDYLTVFQFDMTKHADALRDRLSTIAAVLMTDAESRNKSGAPAATFSHCNAHMFRKLEEAEKVQPILAKEGLRFLGELYAIEDRVRDLGLAGVTKQAYRRHRCRPVLARFRIWLRRVAQGDLPPSDPVRKAARYYLNHWRGLTRYVGDPNLPIDNNEAEREFQRHAKLRYASLFAGSEEGAHRWATLLGVVRTAQKLKLDVQAYLTWTFERRGTHRRRFAMAASELTPAAYKAAGCPGSLTPSIPAAA